MADRTCTIEGCGKPHEARGWCWTHYSRWRRHGDPLGGRPLNGRPASERFFEKVQWGGRSHEGTRCLEWSASVTASGYGQFARSPGVPVVAHRWTYERWIGPIPDGMHLHHLCHNRLCVNPAHIELMTSSEHAQLHAKGHSLWAKTHCKQGHEYNEANSYRHSTSGHRVCRICAAATKKRYKARRAAGLVR